MYKYIKHLLLVSIILLAFFLRFYKVTEVPPSLNWDEVSIGYNAYSVLKSGRDEWGVFMPLFFKSYGEYKLPVQIYASIPAIAIFGLNDFGVRLTPVVYGTLTVLLMFFLTNALFRNYKISLISAFLLCVSPWHLQLTRASFESSFALFWVMLGVLFLVKGFKDSKFIIFSMLPFAISMFTYNTERIFTPFFLLAVLLVYFKDFIKRKKILVISFIVFFVLLIPMIPFILSGESSARYKLVSVTDDPGLVPRINDARGHSKLPKPLPVLIHNKIVYVTRIYLSNYLAHFTPDFLFINGAPHKQHHVQGMGELYYFQAPFLLIGIWVVLKKKEKFGRLILLWLLIAFVPVSVTNDSIPHALRTLVAVPTYQFFTAFGIYYSFVLLKNRIKVLQFVTGALIVLVTVINFKTYLNNYYNIYPKLYSKDWQYGYKEVVDFIKEHKNEYDEIVFTRTYGEPHMFTLFYLNIEPLKYRNDPNLNRFETHDWIRVLSFDKFYFPDLGDVGTRFLDIKKQNPNKKILFIGKDGDFPDSLVPLKHIKFLNNDSDFVIVASK